MRSRFRPDRQLTTRMLAVMVLLGLLYVVFVTALVVFIKSIAVIVVIAGGLLVAQYWFSDRIALAALRGHVVTPEQAPQLHGIIDRLCASADMPKPRVAVANLAMPNAFATGRDAKHAVVCVSTGMMRQLEPDELEGVIAHELSHVAHRDVAVITIASFLGVLAGLLMRVAFYSELFGGRRRGAQNQNVAAIILLTMVVSAAVYFVSFLLIRALSRYRELAADQAGATLTGQPSKLASALVKTTQGINRIPTRDLRGVQAFNAFFFSPTRGGFSRLFSTHPTLERRLAELEKLSKRLNEPH